MRLVDVLRQESLFVLSNLETYRGKRPAGHFQMSGRTMLALPPDEGSTVPRRFPREGMNVFNDPCEDAVTRNHAKRRNPAMRTLRVLALRYWGLEALMLLMAVISVLLLVVFG